MKQQILGRNLTRQAGAVLGCVWLTVSSIPAYANCPVTKSGTTVVVRAPGGNLTVDTSGSGVVEISITGKGIQIQEVCGPDTIRVEGIAVATLREAIEWKIRAPKSVNLDLTTNGGSIKVVGDADGEVKLRTSGGSVTAASIRRDALMYTQAGPIRAVDIGGHAELHSEGGNIDVRDVRGNAILKTASGWINAGKVGGSVRAETGGGSITIKESGGEYFVAMTKAGNISVTGGARRIDARTEGGAIKVGRAWGDFKGLTDSGDIRVDMASSSIDAISKFGDIFIRMDPDTLTSDFHINIQTGNGNITFYLPEMMRASIEATVDKVAAQARQPIGADFPMSRTNSLVSSFLPGNTQTSARNGGGPPVKLRASVGSIQIRINP